MDPLTPTIIYYIETWGYLAIFIGMLLESVNFPLPSELILGFAGYLIFLEHLFFLPAFTAGVLGGLAGSLLSYALGYYGGRSFIVKYGRHLPISSKHLSKSLHWLKHYGMQAVFFARFLPILRTFISLPAGFAKLPLLPFSFYTALGSCPWTAGLLVLGIQLGRNWEDLITYQHYTTAFFILSLLVTWMLWKEKYWRLK